MATLVALPFLATTVMLIIFYGSMSHFPQLDDRQLESKGNLTYLPLSSSTEVHTAGNH